MVELIKEAKVAFCSVTKPDGHKNGKHLLGIYVSKKFKKKVEADFEKVWQDGKTSKAKKPVYDMADWFSKDEKDKEKIIFWLTARADKDRGIIFKQGKGCDFKQADFGKIGAGSTIDLSYDLYYFNSTDYGEMVSRSIKAISLMELVAYEGDDGGVEGDVVEFNSFSEEGEKPKKEKKVKKDKGEKKKKKKDK